MDVPSTNPAASALPSASRGDLRITAGWVYAMFAYDVGLSIRLDQAERRIEPSSQHQLFRRQRRTPRYFNYRPSPLRVTGATESIALGTVATDSQVEFVIYDFGAVSVTYRIPLHAALSELDHVSDVLFDNAELLADSRRGVERLVAALGSAVTKPSVAEMVEDYFVYQVAAWEPAIAPAAAVETHGMGIARLLRAATETLSPDEVAEALSCRIAYGVEDLAIIDWNAALIFDRAPEDNLAVLEYANVELLEMRFLDDQLDAALDEAYDAFGRASGGLGSIIRPRSSDMRRIARLQVDSAVLFEGVNNALKLLGDQWLARVYRLAAQRLHIGDWDTSIFRKLNTLDSIYQKLEDQQGTRRMEVLEWIIIILITVSIILPFVGVKY